MSCAFIVFLLLYICAVSNFSESVKVDIFHSDNFNHRQLLSDAKRTNTGNRTHNDTKEAKIIPNSLKEDESMAGTEAAVLIIVVIVVLSVIGMVVYFIRKFDQLNRSLPTYRYSSLKTDINGVYGPEDKTESQVLVSVSTEEEEDYDDDDDDDDDYVSPPTLLVRSQTVMPSKTVNGCVPVCHDNSLMSSGVVSKTEEASLDSDDELLQ